jgi:hypothetical protein
MTDRQIAALVYEQYGLTAEEIAVVERATDGKGDLPRAAGAG